ncbi:hypothetical protein RRG08_062054 [Elysia crispata]|uniref:Uncharacterized protein n=1 Tax=Elysia crispata TaxID=231223 RepID=A0AAE0Y565_9GAST|nr:hypothetical protein RRG08_062054 [Elysia crispata]
MFYPRPRSKGFRLKLVGYISDITLISPYAAEPIIAPKSLVYKPNNPTMLEGRTDSRCLGLAASLSHVPVARILKHVHKHTFRHSGALRNVELNSSEPCWDTSGITANATRRESWGKEDKGAKCYFITFGKVKKTSVKVMIDAPKVRRG